MGYVLRMPVNDNILLLAQAAYPVIRHWKIQNRATRTPVSYSELISLLPQAYTSLDPRSGLLAGALGYICERCRAVDVPALSSLVVAKETRRPGSGYYPAAHGLKEEEPRAIEAWQAEFDRCWKTKHPPELP